MGIPNGTHQAAADGMKALANPGYISLHTGAGGGTTGANEASGGGYARQSSTPSSGTTGTVTYANVTIPCAAATYTEGGINSALTGGTFVGSNPFTGGNVIVSGAGASIVVSASLSA